MERVYREGDCPVAIRTILNMFKKETKGALRPSVYRTTDPEELIRFGVEEDCVLQLVGNNPGAVSSKVFLVGWGAPKRMPMKEIEVAGEGANNAVVMYCFVKRSKIPALNRIVEQIRKEQG